MQVLNQILPLSRRNIHSGVWPTIDGRFFLVWTVTCRFGDSATHGGDRRCWW